MRFLTGAAALLLMALPISSSADTITSSLDKMNWIVGSWTCHNHTTANGKAVAPRTTHLKFQRMGNWIEVTTDTAHGGITYNPGNAHYVYTYMNNNGGYGIIYQSLGRNSMTFNYPSVISKEPSASNANQTATLQGPNKMVLHFTGVPHSGPNSGKHVDSTSTCTK